MCLFDKKHTNDGNWLAKGFPMYSSVLSLSLLSLSLPHSRSSRASALATEGGWVAVQQNPGNSSSRGTGSSGTSRVRMRSCLCGLARTPLSADAPIHAGGGKGCKRPEAEPPYAIATRGLPSCSRMRTTSRVVTNHTRGNSLQSRHLCVHVGVCVCADRNTHTHLSAWGVYGESLE